MHAGQQHDISLVLNEAGLGKPAALDRLVELVHDELHEVAARLMKQERPDHTLQPTALVNEVIIRLLMQDTIKQATNRRYFFAAAARAMRQILVDYARKRDAAKRLGSAQRVPFDETLEQYEKQNLDVLALNEALEELKLLNARHAEVMELRYFGGFTVPEVADLLEVSVSLVESDYRVARSFLRSRME